MPQGSCLGPLLFLIGIYTSTTWEKYVVGKGELVLFADDTNIFVRAGTKLEVFNKTNKILELISLYMTQNKLHISTSKSAAVGTCTSPQSPSQGRHISRQIQGKRPPSTRAATRSTKT